MKTLIAILLALSTLAHAAVPTTTRTRTTSPTVTRTPVIDGPNVFFFLESVDVEAWNFLSDRRIPLVFRTNDRRTYCLALSAEDGLNFSEAFPRLVRARLVDWEARASQ